MAEPLSEAEYLEQQARQARHALSCALQDAKSALKSSADVRLWAQQYPLAVTASALVAGFLASSAVVPPRRRAGQARRRRRMRRARSWATPLINQVKRLIRAHLQRVILSVVAGAVLNRAHSPIAEDGHVPTEQG